MTVAALTFVVSLAVVLGLAGLRLLYRRHWTKCQDDAVFEVLSSCSGLSDSEVKEVVARASARLESRRWPLQHWFDF